VLEQLSACLKKPNELADWEFRKVRKDGSLLWVKETARAVRAPDGGMVVLIVCEDITERRRAEEAVQEAREELESRVERQMQRGNAYGLSFRELTVLNLVAAGKSDKEIAGLLGISLGTASKHTGNILGKMGASSRTEAGVRAVREGLLD
jgi:DNA-binding NarL/FixJ family response regulator